MRGTVIKRAPGAYAVVVDLGRGPDGKRIRRWHSGYTTKKAAELARTDLLARLDRGEYVDPSKATLAGYLDRWLAYKAGRVEPETVNRYRELLELYVIPRVGHLAVQKLQPLHLVGLYAELAATARQRGTGTLSPRTVLHVHRVLSAALKQAVRWRVVAVNVTAAVDPPAVPDVPMVTLDRAQARRLMTAAADAGGPMRVLVVLALATGARRGELAAVRWADVDLDAGTLRIARARRVTVKAGARIKQPKTAAGARTVVLPPFAVAELRRHRAEQAAVRLALGGAYDSAADLVICRPDGRANHPDSLTAAFRDLADASGLPKSVHLHTLRHSAASFLAAEGTAASDIAAVLGHADGGALALWVYVHPLPDAQARAAARLEQVLGEDTGS